MSSRRTPGHATRIRRKASDASRGYVQLLAQAASALAEGSPARRALDSVLREARRIVQADRAMLCFLDQDSKSVRCVAALDVPIGLRRAIVHAYPSLDHRALYDSPEGLHSSDLADDPRWSAISEAARREGVRALGIFSLKFRSDRLGFVAFFCNTLRACAPEDVAVGNGLACEIALALHHARLVREHRSMAARLRERVAELSLLSEVSSKISRSLDLSETLRAITENMARIVDASAGYIFLADESEQVLKAVAVSPEARPLISRLRIGFHEASGAVRCYLERKPIQVERAHLDPTVNQRLVTLMGAKSLMFVPLLLGERAIGVIVFQESDRYRAFTPEEIVRAQTVADQVAVAVDHARLYEDLRRSHDDLVRAQSQVVESTRLAAIGEMAAIVAHEIRNPLGIIQNSVEMLRSSLPFGEGRDELFTILGQETRRLNRMLSEFLLFSRPKRPARAEYDLVEAVTGVCDLAQRDAYWLPTLRLECRLPLPPCPIEIDLDLFKQALFNLLVNAMQAMPDGGVLAVSAAVTNGPEGAVRLTVGDTGIGIAPDVRDRIFAPFFSTRPRGTGLGLSIVKQIVEAHGGSVEVESTPGTGTSITTCWPRRSGSSAPIPPAASPPNPQGSIR